MIEVLIVGDDPAERSSLRALLEGHGLVVVEARHGAEALVRARLEPPALVVADVPMPVMDGHALLRQWRSDHRLTDIPFLVYTATASEAQDERLALALGADAFVVRPADPAALLVVIDTILSAREREAARAPAPGRAGETQPREDDPALLARRLEKKAFQLEQANRELLEEIVERKQTEAALGDSEERYRSLFHAVADPLFVYDCETLRYLAVNDAAVERYGYRREEFLRRTIREIRPVEDVAALTAILDDPDRGAEPRRTWRHHTRDGTAMEVEISSHRLDYGGRAACLIQARDVTEKRRMEAEAARSHALLRAVADGMTDAVFVKDDAGKYLLFNEAASRFVGRPVEDVLGRDDRDIFDPESAAIARESDRLVMESNQGYLREERLTAAGVTRVYEAIKTPYRDAAGRVLGVIGVSRDLTERKQADDAQRQQRALVRLAGRIARIGGWSLDLATGQVTWSDEICAIHDVAPGYRPALASAIDFYPPEYRQRVADVVRACANDGTPFDVELELLTATGRRIWVRAIGEAVRDHDGRITGVRGAFQDIADRKRAEDEQRRLAERLVTTLESVTDGFFTLDRDWRFTYVNGEAERMILRSRASLFGVSVWDAFPGALGLSFEREYRRALADNVTVDFEEFFAPLGRWFAVRAYPSEQGLAVYFRDVTAAREAEQERHRVADALLLRDRAIQAVSQGILVADCSQPDNPVVFVSGGFERLTGYRSEEVLGRNCRFLQGPETSPDAVREMRDAIAAARRCTVELVNYRRDGSPFWNELSITPVLGPAGQVTHFVGVQTDVTERRRLEEQYRQAQKMEAVGRLAGGVAHDFNNLLTIISGYSELLLDTPDLEPVMRQSIVSISEASEQAATLTRQLLGFSRQSLLQPRVLDLNAVVVRTTTMLRRLIGEDILLTTVLDPALSRVKVDPGQLDQVLMNLAVNARDAMPRGGSLTVETRDVILDREHGPTHLDCTPGPYVMLAISDTGTGMTPEVMTRIFEPFYTTKAVGRGTGLGLAMVFGIVEQSGGCMHVYSEPERGSTFKIYLPIVADQLPARMESTAPASVTGSETILLVEDEEGVRGLASLSLSMHGYQVLMASDGREALRVARAHPGPLHLVLTDVVMPNLSGPALASQLKIERPALRVLFMSGYTDDAVVRHGLIAADMAFIQKPYTPTALARKVREVLDQPPATGE